LRRLHIFLNRRFQGRSNYALGLCLLLCTAFLCLSIAPASLAQSASATRAPAAKKKSKSSAIKGAHLSRKIKSAADSPKSEAAIPAGAKIEKISVKGNKKIEVDAVVTRLISKEGDALDMEHIRQDVEALYKSGYFYDVQVVRMPGKSGGVDLTYNLLEKPSVSEIAYEGNSELETDELKEAAGLKPFEILNMNKIREASEKMQKLYEDKGYFLAHISPEITPITEGETVKLTFHIQENDKVKVKRITFLGNRNISDGRLKSQIQTQEGGFFSFVSGAGSYKQDTFDRDVQVLNYAYFNEGYVQVKIDRPQVYVTPDKKGIYITIRVEEGDRFHVGSVDFAGDLLFDRDELFNSVEIKGGNWYAHETLLKDLRTLQAKYGDLGYAYANIIPRTRIREKDKEVDITFEIDKGNKVYFNRITVVGNTKTRDKVVRRELQIREGELYNETRKRESIDNVKRLGFFDEVNFNSSAPADGPDLMNLDIVVKERNTGSIQVGAGYSTYQQFIFNGQVNQINLFGKGQKLGVQVELSKDQSLFNLNFTEPYFLDTKWSVGFDAFITNRQVGSPLEYTENKKGAAVRFGHPLAPYLMGFLRYKFERTLITLTDDPAYADPELYPVDTANGDTSSETVTLEYDKRNDRFAPSKGVYASTSLEYAGLGGSKHYTKGFVTARYYAKLFWDVVFRNNLSYGFIRSNDPTRDPPFNELFLLGGANTLRGFDWYTIGRKRFSTARYNQLVSNATTTNGGTAPSGAALDAITASSYLPFGGTQEAYYNGELEFPLISEAGIKGVFFYDVGQADDILDLADLRSDVGFGFRWFSPIGPLRFEWGFPLHRQDTEGAVSFQFAIGSPF
jgi:outer membrane protein insertion porin family